ncbi:dipeptidase, partial [Dokdonella sp.]|uniref:dipeptidase n=1 Tax=Dokdonella sp. TaxID=2291710 RepID=UPI003C7151AD
TSLDSPMNLTRRRFMTGITLLASAPLWPSMREAPAASVATPGRWPGYAEAIVIDALGGPGEYNAEPLAALSAKALDDVRASGLTAVNLTVSGVGSYARDADETIRNIAYWNAQIAAHPEHLLQVRSAADLAMAKQSGRLGLVYGFQDATPLGEDLERVALYDDLGVRVFQLTYNRRNLIGDGCLEPGNAGLSALGRTLVERLNERHLLIDLSHAGERTTREAIARSAKPVAISHSGCAALAALPRNKTDTELRELADKDGVVGIYLMPFLRTQGQPTAEDLVAHIEHALQVCGEDHVGIGSDGTISPIDFNDAFKRKHAADVADRRKRGISAPGEDANVYTFLPDLNTADRLATLAALLARRGHSDARIGKIIGGNFARLFRETRG